MKKNIKVFALASVILSLCASFSFAKDFWNDFVDAIQNKNFEKASSILQEWEKEEPESTELKIAYFNYYLNRDVKVNSIMGQMSDGRYGLYDKRTYNQDDVKTGISYLDKALEKQPDRLDVHFGKCSSLLQSENYKEATDAILTAIETSVKIKNKWKWSKDELIPNGEEALFSGLNDYCGILFNQGPAESLESVIHAIEKNYPNNIIGLNHTARFYARSGNNKKGIEVLKRAHSLDKKDYIILGNLGYMYELENDFDKARECYKKMLKIDNPESQRYGQYYLDELEKRDESEEPQK